MNELTKEASKQTILEAISFLWIGGRGRVRKSRIDHYRSLQGTFQDYTTENPDVSSPCEVLPPDYQAFLDSNKQKFVEESGVIDIEAFRSWCEALDKDEEWIAKTERELF